MMASPVPESRLKNWKGDIEGWDLDASGEHIQVTETMVILNGKPTGFSDVKEGPAVYIGRENSHYGLEGHLLRNQWPVSEYGRKDSVLNYADALIEAVETSEEYQDAVMSLYGKPVACWCIPKICHAHVISLYLAYRLHAGMDPRVAGDHITKTIQNRIDSLITSGEANPAEYY